MSVDKEDLFKQAKMAEQAERYTDMAAAMKAVAEFGEGLNEEQRNFLSVAYKTVVGKHRSSWRVLNAIEQLGDTTEFEKRLVVKYRKLIEDELKAASTEVLALLEYNLLPKAVDDESKTFYQKMKGDYFRYLAEIAAEAEKEEVVEMARASYVAASDIANEKLPPTHSVRLGLALNYSVFLYEIINATKSACDLAKKAYEEAFAELETIDDDDSYRDATLILQLLRDNLTLWSHVAPAEQDADEGNAD